MNNLNNLLENILQELRLDTKINLSDYNVRIKKTKNNLNLRTYTYHFTFNDEDFIVEFEEYGYKKFEVLFAIRSKKLDDYIYKPKLKQGKLSIHNIIFFKIIARIVEDFIRKFKPKVVDFFSSGGGDVQRNLYDKFGEILKRRYPNYDVSGESGYWSMSHSGI